MCDGEQAQTNLDQWCTLRGDTWLRPTGDGKATAATLAAADPHAGKELAAIIAICPPGSARQHDDAN